MDFLKAMDRERNSDIKHYGAVNKAAKEKDILKALKGRAFANDPKRKDKIKAQKERIKAMKKAAKVGNKTFYKNGDAGMRYHVTKAKFEKVKETHFPGPVKDAYDNKRLKKMAVKGQIDHGLDRFPEAYDRLLGVGIKKFK